MKNKFYCSYNALEQLAMYPESYGVLRALLLQHEEVILDLEPVLLTNELNNPESNLTCLLEICANSFIPHASPGFQLCIEQLLVGEGVGAIFILDNPQEECQELRGRYGVCVVSLQEPHIADLLTQLLAYKELVTEDAYQVQVGNEKQEGWAAALTGKELPISKVPLNALVVTDTYLFGSRGKDLDSGKENLLGLLRALTPARLEGLEFHLLLVANNEESRFRASNFAAFSEEITQKLGRPYPVKIGMITRKSGGKDRRAITSNYYFCTSQHGFTCFKGAHTTYDNDFVVKGAFMGFNQPGCDLPLKSMRRELKAAKKLLDDRRRLEAVPGLTPDPCRQALGFCDNRLFDLV